MIEASTKGHHEVVELLVVFGADLTLMKNVIHSTYYK